MKKILVINLGGIGDILMSLPALKALRRLYPEAQISVWVVPRAKEILEGLDYFDELISFDISVKERRGFSSWFFPSRLGRLVNLLSFLRGKNFDLAINLRPLISGSSAIKMWFMLLFIRAKQTAGRDTEKRGSYFNYKYKESYISSTHEVCHQAKVIEMLGAVIDDWEIKIRLSSQDEEFARKFLEENKLLPDDLVIGINPGAPWPAKRWPLEYFSQVIKELQKEERVKIVITGSQEEVVLAQELQRLTQAELIISSGKTTLKQLAALLKRFNLFITNDTGAMHIAASMNVPTVAIFRPGHLERNRPFMAKDRYEVLAASGLECAPCQKVDCSSLKCLADIKSQVVIKTAATLLKRVGGSYK